MNITVRNTISGDEEVILYPAECTVDNLYSIIGEALTLEEKTFDVSEGGEIVTAETLLGVASDTVFEVIINRKVSALKRLSNMGHSITGKQFLRSIEKGDETTSGLFIDAGVNINCSNEVGVSAIQLAIEHENYNICSQLIRAGADLDVQCFHQSSPLGSAIQLGNYKIANLLIESGCKPSDKVDAFGHTHLEYAISAVHDSNLKILQLLLDAGANLDALKNYEEKVSDEEMLKMIEKFKEKM